MDTKEDKKQGSNMNVLPDDVVFPGQVIAIDPNTSLRLGEGFIAEQNTVMATLCGVLVQGNNRLAVKAHRKFYIPFPDDNIIGTVVEKHTEAYRVDIGTTHLARLCALAFEGASRRNRPNIPVGALVYCRVEVANKDLETALTCISPYMKKDWVTGESLFGELKGGYCFSCSLGLSARLFEGEDCWVLNQLEKHGIRFEIAAGVNGKVWVNSETPLHTIIIVNAIINSENLTQQRTADMVAKLVRVL